MMERIARLLGSWLRGAAVRPDLQVRREPLGARVLILAPHPDDEIIGCGGALVKHVQRNDVVCVLFLSRGAFPDRLDQDSSALYATRQAEIYVPSPLEEHPEHIATTGLQARSLEAMGTGAAAQIRCAFYQVWGYTIPNYLLDVADVLPQTIELLQLYRSQLRDYDYESMHRWLRRRWTMHDTTGGYYETFWTCLGDRFVSLSQRRGKTLVYRGVWAVPYAMLLSLRRRRRFRGRLRAWSFTDAAP